MSDVRHISEFIRETEDDRIEKKLDEILSILRILLNSQLEG